MDKACSRVQCEKERIDGRTQNGSHGIMQTSDKAVTKERAKWLRNEKTDPIAYAELWRKLLVWAAFRQKGNKAARRSKANQRVAKAKKKGW